MKKIALVFGVMLFVSLFVVSCNNSDDNNRNDDEIEKRNPIIGTWQSTYVSAKFASFNGTEKDTFFEVTQPDFLEVLGISNNIGYYYEDGSYVEKYFDKNDSLLMAAKGRWQLIGDSIEVQQRSPSLTTNKLHFKMDREFGTFTGYVDWDRDGAKDDFYVAVAKKVEW